jgi:hypothetical protein
LAKKTVFVQALLRIRENTYDADINPVSHIERWGFVFELIPIRKHTLLNNPFSCYNLNRSQQMQDLSSVLDITSSPATWS